MSFTSKGNPLESFAHGQPSASQKCLNLPHEFRLSSIKGKNVKNLFAIGRDYVETVILP